MKRPLWWVKWVFAPLAFIFILLSIPELSHSNHGQSASRGTYSHGKMDNGYLLPYSGSNFNYFSPFSFFILNSAYVHSRVFNTVIEAYHNCETTSPDTHFRIMECSRPSGGKMLLHRTHQHGLSVDFMVPKKKNGNQFQFFDRFGLLHYLLEFDTEGKSTLNKNVVIDFEAMGRHILALDDAARKNGLYIRMIILKINLKGDLYATDVGREIKKRGIYFAQSLPPLIDRLHDDHYHVDFGIRQ